MLIVHSCMCPILLVTQKASVGMYSGCDKLSRLQIMFVHVLFDPAIPTSSFNFIQLFFILVTVLFYRPQGNS